MEQALKAGRPVDIGAMTSIARTLGATVVGNLPFQLIKRFLTQNVVVSDAAAIRELRYLLECCKVLAEPASSCTVAALDQLKDRFNNSRHVVLVLCGGNIGLEDFFEFHSPLMTGNQQRNPNPAGYLSRIPVDL